MRLLYTAIFIFVFSLLLFAADESNTTSDEKIPTVDEIINKANLVAYYQGQDAKAKVNMTITDKKGRTRQREFIILRKDLADGGDQMYYVYFLKPADVRKMVYLVHKHTAQDKDDDRWLYLPALDLVKRIAAGDKRTSFVGSDFLYEDVSGRSLEEDSHELIETTDSLFIVKNVPKNPDNVEFAYYNVSIDRSNFIPVKMQYYDRQGSLYRTIEAVEVEEIQKFPTVVKAIVTDFKTESKTEMRFSDVKYDINLEDDIFTERYLRRPPREAIR